MITLSSVVITLERIATKKSRIGSRQPVSIPLAMPGVFEFIQGAGEGRINYSDICIALEINNLAGPASCEKKSIG